MKCKKFKKIFFSFFSCVLFGSLYCYADASDQKKYFEIPQWYLNSPVNTQLFLYGSGEGDTLETAKLNALNNMASSLVVFVSSSFKTNIKSSIIDGKETYSKNVSKDLKMEVQKIKFTNATVKNSQFADGKFYVLMQVNRLDLFSQQKVEFDEKDNKIDSMYASLGKKSKLSKIYILQDVYLLVKDAKSKAVILNAINNDFSYSFYFQKYDKYISMIDDIKNSAIINIDTNLPEKYFTDQLIDMLNINKFTISKNNSLADILIKLNIQPKYSVTNGWNIAKIAVTLSVISENKIVSNRVINVIGRSSVSQESALENGSKQFREELENITLDKVIFGN